MTDIDDLNDVWYEVYYKCPNCESEWTEEYDCACDSECPDCETGDITPYFFEEI